MIERWRSVTELMHTLGLSKTPTALTVAITALAKPAWQGSKAKIKHSKNTWNEE